MKAVVPTEIPPLPKGATETWRRSLRAGSVFHAHVLGHPICRATVRLERNTSEAARTVGDLQYWGVCPRCYAKGQKDNKA